MVVAKTFYEKGEKKRSIIFTECGIDIYALLTFSEDNKF